MTLARTLVLISTAAVVACGDVSVPRETSGERNMKAVNRQQDQYSHGQPVPFFDWSLERDLLIQIYQLRNRRAATHAVWRAIDGSILYDCPAIGFGIPYDTSLTNPLVGSRISEKGHEHRISGGSITSIEQAEPNGVFASKNTAATWVMCAGDNGLLDPVSIEAPVNVYPFPLDVDYTTDRIRKAGPASVTLIDNSERG